MIKFGKPQLPKSFYLAFSGGVDSVAVLDFLVKRHNVTMLHVDHGDEIAVKEREMVHFYADHFNINYVEFGGFDFKKASTSSKEGAWRNFRYKIFNSMDMPVVTCHHLDDCIESYIFSSLHGIGSTIKPIADNVWRPFLLNDKENFVHRATVKNLIWVEDETNTDALFCKRNYIRNVLMPHIYHLSPGIRKIVRKMIMNAYDEYK